MTGPFLADNLGKEIADIVGAVLESTSLGRFFQLSVRRSLDDLLLPEDEAAWYLGDLLTRYAAPSHSREGLADRFAEIQRAWAIDGADFDPAREVEIRREIGDYTLFMTGFFWERVEAMSAQHHYARLGGNAYRFVAEHHRALGRPDAAIYRALASDFMRYAVVLMYVRELYAE